MGGKINGGWRKGGKEFNSPSDYSRQAQPKSHKQPIVNADYEVPMFCLMNPTGRPDGFLILNPRLTATLRGENLGESPEANSPLVNLLYMETTSFSKSSTAFSAAARLAGSVTANMKSLSFGMQDMHQMVVVGFS